MGTINIITDIENLSSEGLNATLIFSLIFGFVVVLAFYFLRSFGLYKITKNNKKSKKFEKVFCFIPILWIYTAGKLCGEVIFFKKKIKNFGLPVVIAFGIFEVVSLVISFLVFFPLVGYYLSGGDVVYVIAEEASLSPTFLSSFHEYWLKGIYVGNNFVSPYLNEIGVFNFIRVLNVISLFANIISGLFVVSTCLMFIRRYSPNLNGVFSIICMVFLLGQFMLTGSVSISSIIYVFSPFVFAIRNKKPINYKEYMQSRYRRFYGNNPNVNNPFSEFNNHNNNYSNNYNNNYYNGNYSENGQNQGEYKDPFSDLSNKDDKDDKNE